MEIKALGYMGFSVNDVPEWRRYLSKLAGLMETPCSTDEQARFRMDSRSWRIGVEATWMIWHSQDLKLLILAL